MTARFVRPPDRAELSRMEEARRATQRQLDLIERDIARRIAAFVSRRGQFVAGEARIWPSDTSTFRRRYREILAGLTAERQSETDALARKLGRQDRAIDAFAKRHGLARTDL